jgi:hypothetical protein
LDVAATGRRTDTVALRDLGNTPSSCAPAQKIPALYALSSRRVWHKERLIFNRRRVHCSAVAAGWTTMGFI